MSRPAHLAVLSAIVLAMAGCHHDYNTNGSSANPASTRSAHAPSSPDGAATDYPGSQPGTPVPGTGSTAPSPASSSQRP